MSSFHKDSIIQKRISSENNTIGNAISVALANVHTPLKSTEQEIQSQAIRGIYLYIICSFRCVCLYIHITICMCINNYMYMCVYTYKYVYKYLYVYTSFKIYVFIYVCIYRHSKRHCCSSRKDI
jgi:hypothetical protein